MMIKRRRGVALLWVLILSAILLIISSTMVNYIIKESQFSLKIGDSSQAYSHAKSGVEWAYKYIENSDSTYPVIDGEFDVFDTKGNLDSDGNKDYMVTIYKGPDATNCPSPALYCIRSTGYKGAVTRNLEYTLKPPMRTIIQPGVSSYTPPFTSIALGDNSESFEIQFDYWTRYASPIEFSIGAYDPDNNANRIYYTITAAGVGSINAESPGKSLVTENITAPVPSSTTAYNYRVVIKYIRDTAASIRIEQRNRVGATFEYVCIGTADIDLTDGYNLGNLSRLYVSTISGGEVSYTNTGVGGDGSYLLIRRNVGSWYAPSYIGNSIDNILIKK